MQHKPLLPLTKWLLILVSVVLVLCLCTLLSALNLISTVWLAAIVAIVAVLALFGTIIQIFQYHEGFGEAVIQMRDLSKALGTLLGAPFRWLWSQLSHLPRTIWVILCFILLISVIAMSVFHTLIWPPSKGPGPPSPTASLLFSYATPDGPIGISDGSYAFDVQTRRDINGHRNGEFKSQAADAFSQHRYVQADSLWETATNGNDSDDAGVLIYKENLRVIESGRPYITFIVATQLTGSHQEYNVGRAELQGAYVAQKEFNFNNQAGSFLVRLLIANIGDQDQYAQMVADHIRDAYKQYSTLKGVVGWPVRTNSINQAIQKICLTNIPLVTTSSNDIIDQSYCNYNFSVVPTLRA